MKQNSIQMSKRRPLQKETVPLHGPDTFFHKFGNALHRIKKITPTLLLAGACLFMAERAIAQQKSIEELNRERAMAINNDPERLKKYAPDIYQKFEKFMLNETRQPIFPEASKIAAPPYELVVSMYDAMMNNVPRFAGRPNGSAMIYLQVKTEGKTYGVGCVLAQEHPYVYIVSGRDNVSNIAAFKISDGNPMFHAACLGLNSFSCIMTDKEGFQLVRITLNSGVKKIPLDRKMVQMIGGGNGDNLGLLVMIPIEAMKAKTQDEDSKILVFTYILGIMPNGKVGDKVMLVTNDGKIIPVPLKDTFDKKNGVLCLTEEQIETACANRPVLDSVGTSTTGSKLRSQSSDTSASQQRYSEKRGVENDDQYYAQNNPPPTKPKYLNYRPKR